MTRRKKLQKYSDIKNFPNLIENSMISWHPPVIEKVWDGSFFKNDNDITLEVGCGRGEYTVGLAKKFPGKNFIGLEIKGGRLWHGAKEAIDANISNALFIRMQADHLNLYFPEKTVLEIWLTFPVPYASSNPLRDKRRLTSGYFLEIYRSILKPGGSIHLKTDDEELYEYTLSVLNRLSAKIAATSADLYHSGLADDILSIKTGFEMKYLKESKPIKYIRFSL